MAELRPHVRKRIAALKKIMTKDEWWLIPFMLCREFAHYNVTDGPQAI